MKKVWTDRVTSRSSCSSSPLFCASRRCGRLDAAAAARILQHQPLPRRRRRHQARRTKHAGASTPAPSTPAPSPTPSVTVSIVGNSGSGAFTPNPVQATSGNVVWTNNTSVSHVLVMNDGKIDWHGEPGGQRHHGGRSRWGLSLHDPPQHGRQHQRHGSAYDAAGDSRLLVGDRLGLLISRGALVRIRVSCVMVVAMVAAAVTSRPPVLVRPGGEPAAEPGPAR